MAFAPDISFRLENFRPFKDSGTQELRPLTFLVGENSAGKSSLLAALNYLLRFRQGAQKSSFNSPPFELGGFEQIVFSRKGVSRPDCFEFELSGVVDLNSPSIVYRFARTDEQGPDRQLVIAHLVFKSVFGEPRISEINFKVQDLELRMSAADQVNVEIRDSDGIIFPAENDQRDLPLGLVSEQGIDPQTITYILSQTLYVSSYSSPASRRSPRTRRIEKVVAAAQGISDMLPRRVVANAPTRSSPSRVYNPSDFSFQPDGSHTPYVLNRLKNSDKKNWDRVRSGIEKFGSDAGLFSKLHISRYHLTDSSPFQIGVTVNGRQSNLIDVGYGVSQSLPIVLDSLDAAEGTYFLLQQPEVHLHPQAQAALGSFFVDQVINRNVGYVIETHSDFIINRVRIEVMSGRMPAALLQILYFEKYRSTVRIHQLTIDAEGNIQGDPPGYRKFFLREGHRLLGAKRSVHNSGQ